MNIKKILQGLIVSSVFAVASDAWLLDGENYVMMNAGFSSGTIDKEIITSQIVGGEFGRNFSADWYASFLIEYGVANIETDNSDINIGLRSALGGMKVGYRPTKKTLLYGMAGLSGKKKLFGPMLGCGARWEMFSQLAVYGEYRRTSVSSSSGINNSYVVNAGVVGLQLYFRY